MDKLTDPDFVIYICVPIAAFIANVICWAVSDISHRKKANIAKQQLREDEELLERLQVQKVKLQALQQTIKEAKQQWTNIKP